MRKGIEFSDEQIKQIFIFRSKGKSALAIAERMNCSDATIGRILRREIYSDVKIPENVLELCKTTPIKFRPRKKVSKKKSALNGLADTSTLEGALAAYTSACVSLRAAKEACLHHGINSETLELLRESVRDAV
jgi:hypothetical protein